MVLTHPGRLKRLTSILHASARRATIATTFTVLMAQWSQALAQAAGPVRATGAWIGIAVDSGPRLVIRAVEAGSPAAIAGIKPSDRIERLQGRRATFAALDSMMKETRVGERITLEIMRAGIRMQRELVAARRPNTIPTPRPLSRDSIAASTEDYLLAACREAGSARLTIAVPRQSGMRKGNTTDSSGTPRTPPRNGACAVSSGSIVFRSGDPKFRMAPNVSGLYVMELNHALAKYFAAPVSGLLIIDVQSGSEAERVGFRPGDVVTKLNGKRPTSVVDLMRLVDQDGSAMCELIRHGETMSLVLRK